MIALIRKNDTEVYPSVVFAEFLDGWKTKMIVFDPEYKSLVYVNFWKRKGFLGDYSQNTFIIDTDKSDWGDEKGYVWLLEDNNSMKAIQKGKEVYPGLLRKCKELQAQIKIEEWHELTCDKDADDLLECCLSFHDSAIKSITRENGKILIDFDTSWGSHVIFRIPEEGSELNIDEPWDEEQVGEKWQSEPFFEASIFYRDGFIYWINQYGIESDDEIPEGDGVSWFKATKMEWKLIINPLK